MWNTDGTGSDGARDRRGDGTEIDDRWLAVDQSVPQGPETVKGSCVGSGVHGPSLDAVFVLATLGEQIDGGQVHGQRLTRCIEYRHALRLVAGLVREECAGSGPPIPGWAPTR